MGQRTQRKRRQQTTSHKATVKQLAFIAAILVLIASAIGLYVAYDDLFEDDDVEVIV
ncbi:hypothetical protein [Paenibacillus lautus]|jgi:hypothetical protein|uniref:hypothetical protein n=1 Tax=Paenibacillus lautus TaxID=1401 RepID=UPI0013E28919|nr:hypothetical protein [Paenibacillus lautus]